MNFNLSEEPYFLLDEELLELESILKDVQFRLDNPDIEKDDMILRTFVKACIKATKKEEIQKLIPRIEKKPEILKKIEKFAKVYPVPAPSGAKIEEFKTKARYEAKEMPKEQVDLVRDSYTNRLLAQAEINERYLIKEPVISDYEIKMLKQVIEKKPESPSQALDLLKKLAPDLSDYQLTSIKYYVVNSLFALGRLEPLFHDPKVTGMQCDGIGEYLLIRREGKLYRTNIIFKDREDLDIFLQKLAKKLNKVLDESSPIIDVVHRDFRFHITLGLHGASSRFAIKKLE